MDELICPGCSRHFSEEERPPLTFPSCRHVVCRVCLVHRLEEAMRMDSRMVECPQCPYRVYCASDPANIETVFPRDPETMANIQADRVERECIHPMPDRQWACLDPECEVKTMFCGMCSRAFHHECRRDLVLTSDEATRRLHAPKPNLPGYLPFTTLHRDIKRGIETLEDQLTSLANACDRFVRAERDAIIAATRTPSGILLNKHLFDFVVDSQSGALHPVPKVQDTLRSFAARTISFLSTEFWRQAANLQTAMVVASFPTFSVSSSPEFKPFGEILRHFERANIRFASELVLSDLQIPSPFSFPKLLQEASRRLSCTSDVFRLDFPERVPAEEATRLSKMVGEALQVSPLNFDSVYDNLKAKLEDYALQTGLKRAAGEEFWDLTMAVGEGGDGGTPSSQSVTFRRGDYLICFGPREVI